MAGFKVFGTHRGPCGGSNVSCSQNSWQFAVGLLRFVCRAHSLKRRSSGSFNTIPQRLVIVEAQGRTNQREMRKRLRKVANLQLGFGVIFFTEEAKIVPQCEQ